MPGKRRRRAPGEGHVRQRADGSWEARLPIPGSKPKSYYGRTQKDAIAKRNAARLTVGGLAFDASSLTFGEYLTRWLLDYYRGSVRDSSYERVERSIRCHLIPTLGSVKLDKLTGAHLQSLYRQKSDDGKKPRTVRAIHQAANMALGQAIKWRMISYNPASDVSLPRVSDEEMRPLTREEVGAILCVADDRVGDLLCIVAIFSGLRAGELLGLGWEHIDFGAGVIRVSRALVRVRAGMRLGPPKNEASKRAVDVPPQAIDALKKRRRRQLEERLAAGKAWREWGTIFTRADGRPLDNTGLIHYQLHPLLKRAGVEHEGVRFHDLRHTFATLSLLNGEHPRVVQRQMGHATINETMNRYSHVLPSMGKEAARRLGELF